ncbi:DsrE/DsrF-like family protein [compost metagenome]
MVANAEAVKQYCKIEEYPLFIELSISEVLFVACNNALKANFISKEALPSFVTIVPAGVLELVNKQHEGYSYIKP